MPPFLFGLDLLRSFVDRAGSALLQPQDAIIFLPSSRDVFLVRRVDSRPDNEPMSIFTPR